MAEQIIVKSELEMRNWFEANFKKLGYDKIIESGGKYFPDFKMLKNGKEVGVELETQSSRFVLHKHDIRKVDEVVCIDRDVELGIPIIKIKELAYQPKQERVSATIDEILSKKIRGILKSGSKYRNMSHLIETALKKFVEEESKKK
ncbi:MAG: hypothetical protein KKB21_01775 [Nanoarchaeota archaeon]|nr:hypothetical protein [Nanoarchaeota archaeon]MBU4086286.1 hypothetical protein [Nanoarchaeota archaeon]